MEYSSFGELLSDMPENRTALLFDGGSMSCGEMRRRIDQRAAELRKAPFSCVGILAPLSPEWVVELFSAVIAGKRTVLLDCTQPDDAVASMIRAAGVDELYYDKELFEQSILTALAGPKPCSTQGEGKLLFFTSGTAKMSRAVVLTSRSLCFSAWNGQQMLPCGTGDTVLSLLPLSHVFGFVCTLLWPLCYGAAVALGRGLRYLSRDPQYFRPTILPVVPSLLKFLLASGGLNAELRTVLVGASPCDRETLAAVNARGISVRFGYGLTETSSGVAISREGQDPFLMAPCPDSSIALGDDGEIIIRTPCMMDGYWNDRQATEAVLKDGALYTGDIGRFENGMIVITGRKKDFLTLPNGTKIFCPEWESQLSELLGGDDLAVTLKDGKVILVASFDVPWSQIERFNRGKPFDQYIASVEVKKEPLPRTATGKIRRWAL